MSIGAGLTATQHHPLADPGTPGLGPEPGWTAFADLIEEVDDSSARAKVDRRARP